MIRRRRRADISCSPSKNLEPAIKVRCVDGQRQMGHHRLAVITSAHQRDGRPESAHAAEMTLPVMHLVLEDWADQRVEPGAAVEGAHQPFDHRLVDAGPLDDVCDNQITA
jgi:hypothetical protein